FHQGKLIHGTWQQIIFIDFDTRPRDRKIIVQLIGEKLKK
ncbi:MAG: YjbQ family protein, partial [Candidatus Thermoplasmatota archaeon]|nr:YjbQ family protein [Candidatus Thermoplasmatota archaeon]